MGTDSEQGRPIQVVRPMTVVLVNANPLARLAVSSLLERAQHIRVVGHAMDAHSAIGLIRRLGPRIVLLDLVSSDDATMAALPELTRHAAVLVLTSCADPATVRGALRAGAAGYLVHGEFSAAELHDAVESAAVGRAPMSAAAVDALIQLVRAAPEPVSPPSYLLSEREAEVMDHIVVGAANAEIARELHLSEKTVRNHVHRIYTKLGAGTRAQAIAIWLGTSHRYAPGHAGEKVAVLRARPSGMSSPRAVACGHTRCGSAQQQAALA